MLEAREIRQVAEDARFFGCRKPAERLTIPELLEHPLLRPELQQSAGLSAAQLGALIQQVSAALGGGQGQLDSAQLAREIERQQRGSSSQLDISSLVGAVTRGVSARPPLLPAAPPQVNSIPQAQCACPSSKLLCSPEQPSAHLSPPPSSLPPPPSPPALTRAPVPPSRLPNPPAGGGGGGRSLLRPIDFQNAKKKLQPLGLRCPGESKEEVRVPTEGVASALHRAMANRRQAMAGEDTGEWHQNSTH